MPSVSGFKNMHRTSQLQSEQPSFHNSNTNHKLINKTQGCPPKLQIHEKHADPLLHFSIKSCDLRPPKHTQLTNTSIASSVLHLSYQLSAPRIHHRKEPAVTPKSTGPILVCALQQCHFYLPPFISISLASAGVGAPPTSATGAWLIFFQPLGAYGCLG